MAVTASHFMRKPYTVQYPDRMPVRVQDTLPFRYRGILEVDLEICTGCLACERACPIDCIVIVVDKDPQTRQMLLSQFDIDIAKCMYCGLCSEPCPTGSIHHTTEFEGADYSLESLIRRFVKDPVMAYKPKKGPETDSGDRADSESRHDLPRSMGATWRREAGRRRRAWLARGARQRGEGRIGCSHR